MSRSKKKDSMGLGNILGLVLAGLAILSLVFLAYMGVFNSPRVVEKNVGPYTYVYEPFTGDYAKTGPVFGKLRRSLSEHGLQTPKAIGIYYDNPEKTPKERQHSDCGWVIEAGDFLKIPKLLEKYPARTLPPMDRPVVEFPYRNGLSYGLGAMKAYPVLMKYAEAKKYKIKSAVEVYDLPAGKIIYALDVE